MKRYLLDTSHLGAAIRRDSPILDRIERRYEAGDRFGTCIPALCEVEAGIQQTASPEAHRHRLIIVLRMVRLWPLDEITAQIYGGLHQFARSKGRILSTVDLMLAALAQQKKLTLLTTDKDFAALPQIRTENCLPPSRGSARRKQ